MHKSSRRLPARRAAYALAAAACLALAGAAVTGGSTAWALDNGLAHTPPMGWNPWYRFGCNVSELVVAQTADWMVASGMAKAGYRYVNLDDCWMAKSRDASGNLQADPARFPHGIAALANYVHARGLKLGIYLDAGTATCAGFPGSGGHFGQDAATVASWGIDYVKMDWCNTGSADAASTYAQVRDALATTGRPIVLSICDWGLQQPWTWGAQTGNLWRTAGDYTWYGAPGNFWAAVLSVAGQTAQITRVARPGGWNDPDLLLVGDGVLSPGEERAQMSLWSMMAAPLLAGNDVRAMPRSTLALLTNPGVIAVDQDPAAYPVARVGQSGNWQSWIRPLSGSARALLVLNLGTTTGSRGISVRSTGVPSAPRYEVQNLWTHHVTITTDRMTLRIAPRDVALLRITPLTKRR